jgi:aryl-alcohol dehydrogenase-like predicted oxidoreductase
MTTTGTLNSRTGTFTIAGKPVSRLGFGAMRITGPGIWGEPADHDESIAVLRRAVELGVQLIDTADAYGPNVSEDLIREALHPYPDDLLIATKAGFVRTGPNRWSPVGRPEYLRQAVEMSLRRLGVEAIDLLQLHRIDPQVPAADQVGELKKMQDEGKIVAIGLSQISVRELEDARKVADIASVQNRFNLTDRSSAELLRHSTEQGIGFIPWAPVAAGDLARPGGPVDEIAHAHGATPGQVALAWLLAISPAMLPIPGTSQRGHLEENLAAADLELTADEVAALTAAG